ncbi:MAG TPA: MFS transporter, partial [Acidimicrobiales bacterium]|nr:MFS transporter [Acidimicrobiales bacterium]
PQIWPLYLLTAVAAALSGFERTAHNAAIPNVVDRSSLAAAFALWQLQAQVGLTAGPAVAGLLLGGVGLATVYFIDAATFLLACAAAAAMRPLPPEGGGTRASAASIAEGFRYLRRRRLLTAVFVIDLDAMVLGMPRALFPALGTGLYGGGPGTVGMLYAAVGAGALAGSVFAGWVPAVRRQGLAVLVAVAVWGGAVTAFGLVPWLGPALVLLAVAGAADVVSAVFRTTILQSSVPDALRGRMSAAHIAVVTGGPRLGDAESGAVAALAGPRVSVVSGGVACLLGVLAVARLWPELARYRAADEEAAAVP